MAYVFLIPLNLKRISLLMPSLSKHQKVLQMSLCVSILHRRLACVDSGTAMNSKDLQTSYWICG
jgi:hypothetical protein